MGVVGGKTMEAFSHRICRSIVNRANDLIESPLLINKQYLYDSI